jgi:hypothetical protein
MKLKEIEAGKKYWKPVRTGHSRTVGGRTSWVPVFTLEVNGSEVVASINGGPASKYRHYDYQHWQKDKPTT